MRILFVGQVSKGQTSRMRGEALRELGHEVEFVDSSLLLGTQPLLMSWARRWTSWDSAIARLNRMVIERCSAFHPQLLWCEKQEFLTKETIEHFKERGIKTLHYTPDPYFCLWWKRSRIMDKCLPHFDRLVTSKRYELDEYRRAAGKVTYMPLGYHKNVHRPFRLLQADGAKHLCDVSFIGGWEPRREELLSLIASAGINLSVWGYSWDHLIDGKWTLRRYARLKLLAGSAPFRIHKDEKLAVCFRGGEIYGDEYAAALTGSKISLGFLRAICPDQHTTRTFEIPACGSMLLADRTGEHMEFFEEGKEAEFFSGPEEMLDKIKFYLSHEEKRKKIALAGYERCLNSGYSYLEILKKMLYDAGITST